MIARIQTLENQFRDMQMMILSLEKSSISSNPDDCEAPPPLRWGTTSNSSTMNKVAKISQGPSPTQVTQDVYNNYF